MKYSPCALIARLLMALFLFAAGWPALAAEPPAAASSAVAKQKAAQEALTKKVNGAYKPLFYDNDFSYLNDPSYDRWFPGDAFKQLDAGFFSLDVGGQYRARYHHEQNIRGLGLTGRDDDFLLHRSRLFANARFADGLFRVYAEYLDAESNYEDFAPRGIEVNRSDMLNLFADARVWEGDSGDVYFRAGRQELLYGSERLVSPLDWANTRRTFEGIKLFYQGTDWNADLFAVEPVLVDPHNFDSAIDEQDFFGGFATYKGATNQTYDFFCLQYNNASAPQSFEYTTLGGRWLTTGGPWLAELEGGVQFGENTNGSGHGAGYCTSGLGRKWDDATWKPQVMCYYDWASGNDLRGAGQGFDHLFPLAHKYLGFMDLFARSNIESPNCQVTMQLTPKLKMLAWYYYLFLENKNDTPYNVNMAPFNPANAPGSAELGQEIDLLWSYTLNPRMDVVLGYSHFFAGRYYDTTPSVPTDADADFFYTHYQWNF